MTRPSTPAGARAAARGRSAFALGWLKERVLDIIVRGRSSPTSPTPPGPRTTSPGSSNSARDAEILFIEARFLERDRERAAARRHLTARQAGVLARGAGVKRVVPFHFSPRHAHEEMALRGEVEAAFAGAEGVGAIPTPA